MDGERPPTKRERLAEYLENRLDEAHRELEKFKERLASSPPYAFEWSMDGFRAAARIKVMTHLLDVLRDPEAVDTGESPVYTRVYETALEQVLRGARHPTRSTSPTANLMEQEELAAWADVVEAPRWW